jgi:hypothetical protein
VLPTLYTNLFIVSEEREDNSFQNNYFYMEETSTSTDSEGSIDYEISKQVKEELKRQEPLVNINTNSPHFKNNDNNNFQNS